MMFDLLKFISCFTDSRVTMDSITDVQLSEITIDVLYE